MNFVDGVPKNIVVGQTHAQEHGNTFNIALHVGDDPKKVQFNRMLLLAQLKQKGAKKLTWLTQIHSTDCHEVNDSVCFEPLIGDSLVTQQHGHTLMIMTADCLPIVIGNTEGTEVANLHAGWRGLAEGIVENTLKKMNTKASWAWLGACISQNCFEVGAEVKAEFCKHYAVEFAFKEASHDKYYADLYAIARYILNQKGIDTVLGGDTCTYQQDYFSYRRNPNTGRMATFVFIR